MGANRIDVKFMERAIDLSRNGKCDARPNPLVGAVIVKSGKIIGEGYHEKYGSAHAEINAINSAAEPVAGSTMYVTLEPCSHYGKTPPCADRIISEGFSRVVIGMADPNPLVNGKGIEKLRNAGIEVEVALLEDEIKTVNEIYLKNISAKKPFCVLKTAITLDGKIATKTGDSKWISGEQSRSYVHELRHLYAGIMVGVNTVIADNPFLTDRSVHKMKRNPVRIIVDSKGRTPLDANVLNDMGRTIIAVTEKADSGFISEVKQKGKEIIICQANQGRVDPDFLMSELYKKGIDSVLIEGGGTLNYSMLNAGIVDKVVAFIAPKIVGGADAVTAVEGSGRDKINDSVKLNFETVTKKGDDILIEAYVHRID